MSKPSGVLHRLTPQAIVNAGLGIYFDGGGLILRIDPRRACWVFRYTDQAGRRRDMGLGPVTRPDTKTARFQLDALRDLCARMRANLVLGIDPMDERQRERSEAAEAAQRSREDAKREQSTLARVARDYHFRVIEGKRETKHALQWIASLENNVPPDLWHAPIESITAPALADCLIELSHRIPETARRVRQRLEAVFADAEFRGLVQGNPASAAARRIREAGGRAIERHFRSLRYGEAPAFAAALSANATIAARCLEFTLYTAARTRESTGARWSEFDLAQGVWDVPAERMKMKKPHRVYLSRTAMRVLEQMRELHPVWVFPGVARTKAARKSGVPLSNMAMLGVLDRLRVPHSRSVYRELTTVHGLRATFSTWANEKAHARPDVIEASLAHAEANAIRAAYNRATYIQARAALMEQWGCFLSGEPKTGNAPNGTE